MNGKPNYSLRHEPLSVCIPAWSPDVPSEWIMNDGLLHDPRYTPKPTLEEIYNFEGRLKPFTGHTQGALLKIVFAEQMTGKLSPEFITHNGYKFRSRKIVRYARYGKAGDPIEKQEAALDFLRVRGAEFGFTLGEVKAAIYIATRDGIPFEGPSRSFQLHDQYFEKRRALLGARWFVEGEKYPWGGDIAQFTSTLHKLMDLYEKVYVSCTGVEV